MPFPSFMTSFAPGVPAALEAPVVPRLRSSTICTAGAVGRGRQAIVSARGELLERTHFFAMTRGVCRRRLDEVYPDRAFIHALEQTAYPNCRGLVDGHAFDLVPAINLVTGDASFLPLVTVSIARSEDDPFLPYRDSTGSACHTDPDLGLDAALLEFYERQCLVAATLTGRCRRVLRADQLAESTEPLSSLAEPFLRDGTLRVAEIGFHDGAYVVLAAYEGRPDAAIRYSVGCAAAFTPARALAKALAELHQGYMFFEFHGRAGDDNRFAADNTVDTWRHFPFLDQPADEDLAAFLRASPGGRQILIQALGSVGPNLYCYIGAGETDRSVVAFFKVVSPDFLLTTRIEDAANLGNPFFRSVGLERPTPRHIPFY